MVIIYKAGFFLEKAPVADLCDLVECSVRPDGEVRAGHVVGDGGGQHHLYSTS